MKAPNSRALCEFVLIAVLAGGTATAAPGNVDTGFTASANDMVRTTALQTDGKILIGGEFS